MVTALVNPKCVSQECIFLLPPKLTDAYSTFLKGTEKTLKYFTSTFSPRLLEAPELEMGGESRGLVEEIYTGGLHKAVTPKRSSLTSNKKKPSTPSKC